MKRICISYCLYGNVYKYLEPLEKNFILAKQNTWLVVCAIEESCLDSKLQSFLDSYNIPFRIYKSSGRAAGMIERIYPMELADDFDIVFVRDADSIISYQELDLMKFFIKSDKLFHIIRGHPAHNMPVMGGLLGMKREVLDYLRRKPVRAFFKHQSEISRYGTDQKALIVLYLRFLNNTLIHSNQPLFRFEDISYVNFDKDNYPGAYWNNRDFIFQHEIKSSVHIKFRPKLYALLFMLAFLVISFELMNAFSM